MRALWSDSALALGSRSTGLGKMVQEPRAGFHVAKWGVFFHSAWLQISPALFKQVYSDKADFFIKQIEFRFGDAVTSPIV